MIQSPYTVLLLHEDRVREAQQHYSRSRQVYDLSEPMPDVYEDGLIHRITQWLRTRSERQGVRDVRHVHAV